MARPDSTIEEINEIANGTLDINDALERYIKEQSEWILKQNKNFISAGSDDYDIEFHRIYGSRSPKSVAVLNIRTKMERLNHPRLEDRYAVYNLVSDFNNKIITEEEFNDRLFKRYQLGMEMKDFFLNDYTYIAQKEYQHRIEKKELIRKRRQEQEKIERENDKIKNIGCLIILIIFSIFLIYCFI